ncbi:putative membrane protein YeaQ/YmgE (transglycosylase-associated protein family) [Thermostichus sp. OS-CIW-30]
MNSILWFLLIGALAGWLAGNIRRGYGFGLIGNIIVGVCGAFFGGFLFDLLGFTWPVGYGPVGKLVDGHDWGFGFVGVNWLRSSGLIFKMARKGLCFRWDLDRTFNRTFTGEFL